MRPQGHPSGEPERERAIASPDDDDLSWDMHGMVLDPPIVLDYDVFVEYEARTGWRHGKQLAADDGGAITGTLVLHLDKVDADEYQWFIGHLDTWAEDRTLLRFCASNGRLSALYGPNNVTVPIPQFR